MTRSDEDWMEQARRAGLRHKGATAENPAVGCVIVSDAHLVGVGATQPGGRPHAETEALAMAGEKARGATAYVTLEPCCHHGRTPPCTDALIAAGISRVVIGIPDPDSRVAGKGAEKLRESGISVFETGVSAYESGMKGVENRIERDLSGFLSRHRRGRPHVILKLAMSRDEKIAATAGGRTQITGIEVKNRVHLMRAESDAILVGVSTVKADDPSLTCRLPGMADRSPIRVVSDSNLSIPLDSELVRTARDVPVWILTCLQEDSDRAEALKKAGVQLIFCWSTEEKKVDLHDAMGQLAGRGINTVMAEGGAHMAAALLDADLVDEAVLFEASMELGEGALQALAGMPVSRITGCFQLYNSGNLGDDLMRCFERRV